MAPLRTPAQRILDFDCENRPLSYLGSDFTTPELTGVAWKFIGTKGKPDALCMGEVVGTDIAGNKRVITGQTMLLGFLAAYVQADIITGHNIRKHDLPLLNASLLEQGLSPLPAKMTCDTYADLKRRSPGFASQATLSEMLGVRSPKVGMSTVAWRNANRLNGGVEQTRKRVVGDVVQHIEMRARLLELGWLRAPRLWTP